MRITLTILLVAVVSCGYSWNIPNLPSGRRSQYYVLHDDGGYKYGYDTDNSYFAKQSGDSQNEVSGHYAYQDVNGRDVDVRYTAGVQGFVPEGLERLPQASGPHAPIQSYSYPAPSVSLDSSSNDDQANTGDASYSFNIDTDTYQRQESSDASGNVQGRYSYSNEAGNHDLSYIAGSNTGFVATSGSLSVPNGIEGQASPAASVAGRASASSADNAVNADGSYSFGFSTNDQSRQESADASGNVQGRYSYTNAAGSHDLSYVAGSATGFQPTGGSLSLPNGLARSSDPQVAPIASTYSAPAVGSPAVSSAPAVPNADGSYAFSYATNDQSRQESSDVSGNVQGRYSFTNEAGTHDLSYVAGSATGFQPTGGSLSLPNGLARSSVPQVTPIASTYSAPQVGSPAPGVVSPAVPNADGSYAFSYATNDQSRQESSDVSGNVQGRYSFTNEAGTHDLSYVAGSATGFQPTGGSLSLPNGLARSSVPQVTPIASTYSAPQVGAAPAVASPVMNADGSYSFGFSTNDQSRQESADASGNVQGRYSYTNAAGSHDLSYVAGSATGFLPTGGSLAAPNGLEGNSVVPSSAGQYSSDSSDSTDDESNTGDASYNFTVDTDDYRREESSDAQGNVRGSFSYTNAAGQHDLSYVAGSETGFLPTGGSLSLPNGLAGRQAESSAAPSSGSYIPPVSSYSSGSQESQDDQANTGDASYSFTVDTPEYQRQESADTQGNVRGMYTYRNMAGSHDLSYVAGSNTGFVATSGSLSVPNGIGGSEVAALPVVAPAAAVSYLPPQARATLLHSAAPSENRVGNVVLRTYLPSESHSKYGYSFESA